MSYNNIKLSEGALEIIMNGGDFAEPTVQVLGVKKINAGITDNQRYKLLLSDGQFSISLAMLTSSVIGDESLLEDLSVIKLKRYITNLIHNNSTKNGAASRVLLILDLEILCLGSEIGGIIGNPTRLSNDDVSGSYKPVAKRQIDNLSITPSLFLRNTNAQTKNLISKYEIISPIGSLNPYFNNWLIKARVVNKTEILTWSNARGEGRLFSFSLLDTSGEIRCTGFNDVIDKFYNLIEIDKIYFLCKCLIKRSNKQYNSSEHGFEMTMTLDSVIEESIGDDSDSVPQTKYNFVSIDKIKDLPERTVIDVIAICKSISNIQSFTSKTTNRQLRKRELYLIDQSGFSILLSLWGRLAENFDVSFENPVIVIKSARVGEFAGGKNLSSSLGTVIKLNPDMTECHRIRAWFDLEGAQTQPQNISSKIGNFNSPWMTLSQVVEKNLGFSERGDYFQIFGTLILIRGENSVYKACASDDCNKKVINLENGMYRCEKCNREYPNFKYRLMASAVIADNTGSVWVSMFSNEAETILGMTSHDIGVALDEDFDAAIKIFERASYRQFVFKCRAKVETYNDAQRVKIVVIRVDSINYDEYNSHLVEDIQKLAN